VEVDATLDAEDCMDWKNGAEITFDEVDLEEEEEEKAQEKAEDVCEESFLDKILAIPVKQEENLDSK
jgi:hypothetical protein